MKIVCCRNLNECRVITIFGCGVYYKKNNNIRCGIYMLVIYLFISRLIVKGKVFI